MKRSILFCVAVLVASTQLFAADSYPMAIGPYLMLNASVNAGSIPSGEKTGVAFNGTPDFGAEFYMPFTKLLPIGATLDVGYQTYALVSKPNSGSSDDNTFTTKYHYFAISPSFVASIVSLGFTFGIPAGVGTTNTSGTYTKDGATSDMATIVSAHIGVAVPILNDNTGRLNFLVFASYVLTGMDASTAAGSYNPVAASMGLGFNYLFKIGD